MLCRNVLKSSCSGRLFWSRCARQVSWGSVFALPESARLHLRVHVIEGDCEVLCRKLWLRPLPRCIAVLLCRLVWTPCAGEVSLGSVLALLEAARQHLRVYVTDVHCVVLFSKVAAMWSAALHCSAAVQAPFQRGDTQVSLGSVCTLLDAARLESSQVNPTHVDSRG